MNDSDRPRLVKLDRAHVWHPFTPLRDWCAPTHEPLILVSGEGAVLRDESGREYLDGNSSIWTNLHGHNHPRLNAAIGRQLQAFAHCSFLGQTHPVAIELAAALVALFPRDSLTRVFFSDDGSTAVEVALRIAREFWLRQSQPARRKFLAFDLAYHGDTLGAASLGGIATFRGVNADAEPLTVVRIGSTAELDALAPEIVATLAGVVIEPLIQGAAGMRLWPAGMLATLRAWCDHNGILLIADEVMTGFGRTGTMFACEQEDVLPDLLCLAKGLTGGYLPLAATLTTEPIFRSFQEAGTRAEQTLFYGHSYTGNALGCAAALENLAIFREEQTLERLQPKIALLADLLGTHLAPLPHVAEIRQCGFIVGIDLEMVPKLAKRYPPEALVGARVCHAARKHGLLTRPIRDTLVLMPPYCISPGQLEQSVEALRRAVLEITAEVAEN